MQQEEGAELKLCCWLPFVHECKHNPRARMTALVATCSSSYSCPGFSFRWPVARRVVAPFSQRDLQCMVCHLSSTRGCRRTGRRSSPGRWAALTAQTTALATSARRRPASCRCTLLLYVASLFYLHLRLCFVWEDVGTTIGPLICTHDSAVLGSVAVMIAASIDVSATCMSPEFNSAPCSFGRVYPNCCNSCTYTQVWRAHRAQLFQWQQQQRKQEAGESGSTQGGLERGGSVAGGGVTGASAVRAITMQLEVRTLPCSVSVLFVRLLVSSKVLGRQSLFA